MIAMSLQSTLEKIKEIKEVFNNIRILNLFRANINPIKIITICVQCRQQRL